MGHRRTLAALATVAVATLATVTSCAPVRPMPTPTPTPTPTVSSTADGVLRIGTLVSRSATSVVAGVELAVRDVNIAGGVAGVPVEVFHRTVGALDTDQLETSFDELAQRGVDVIIGPGTEAQRLRLAPRAAAAGVLLMSPTGSVPPDVSDPLFVSLVPTLSDQATALSAGLVSSGVKRVTLIEVTDSSGVDAATTAPSGFAAEVDTLAVELGSRLDGAGVRLALSTSFDVAEPDLPRLLAALSKSRADHIVLTAQRGGAPAVAEVISAVMAAGYPANSLWLTSTVTTSFDDLLPAGALEGAHGLRPVAESDKSFARRISQSDPGVRSHVFAGESYDAVIVAALAAYVGEDDGGASIAQRLRVLEAGAIPCLSFGECVDTHEHGQTVDYDGVSGRVDFAENGAIHGSAFARYVFSASNVPKVDTDAVDVAP